MNRIRYIIPIFSIILAASEVLTYAVPKGIDILKKIDEIEEMTTDVRAKVNISQTKNGQTKKIELLYYRRDSDDAFLMVMLAPETDKGNGYLRVKDNIWMYRQNTRTFQIINRDEPIGGSDAKANDFEKRKITELYEVKKDAAGNEVTEEKLGAVDVYRVEVKAKVNDVDYPKKIYWVRRDNFLRLKEQSFSNSGTLMQTAYYMNYTVVDGRYVPVKQLFIDEFEKGNKSLVEISGISTSKLSDIFNKAYLENLSK